MGITQQNITASLYSNEVPEWMCVGTLSEFPFSVQYYEVDI